MARSRALQHRRRRLRQAPAGQARDDPRALRRRGAQGQLGRAAGPLQPGRQRALGTRGAARRPRRDRAAADARDRGDVLRDLEDRRAPAVDVGALRRRRDPAPAHRLAGQGAGHRRRERAAVLRGLGRADPGARRRHARRRLDGLRDRRHGGRRPGAALLHVRHHRPGQGHRPRPSLPARPRGVHLLPRGAGRRALPRHGRVGLGGRHRAAARAVAAGRGAGGLPARGRLRPAQAAGLPVAPRGHERLHDAHGDALDDGHRGRGHALPAEVPARVQRRRAAQPGGDPLVPRAVRPDRARLLRADRVLSARRQLPVHGGPRGLDGAADARLGRPDPRRGREAGAAGRARRDLPARAGPTRTSRSATGTSPRPPRRRSAASGSTPRTRRCRTRTATSGTPGAPTT